MISRQGWCVRIGFVPSPIVGNAILIHKNHKNLSRIRWSFLAVGPVTVRRDAAVAPPADAATILILFLSQTFKDGGGFPENVRHEIKGFLNMPSTKFFHGMQLVVRDEHHHGPTVVGVHRLDLQGLPP